MGRYNFVSPAGMAGDALVDQLARSRAEKRQQMLDEITAKNAESQRAAQAANSIAVQERAAADKAWRDSQMQAVTNAQSARDRRHETIKGILGDDAQTLDPGVKAALQIADAGEDDNALNAVINHMLTPKKPETRTGGYLWTTDEKGNPYNSGQWMEGVQGDQFHPFTPHYPPQAPASLQTPQLVQVPDPEHQGQFLSYWLKPGEMPSEKNFIKGGAFKGSTPPHMPTGSGAGVNGAPNAAEFINLTKLVKAATPKPGLFGLPIGGGTDPAAQAALDQGMNSILARMPGVDRNMLENVVHALEEDPKVPSAEIVNHQLQNGMDPKDAEMFSKLLMIARGR